MAALSSILAWRIPWTVQSMRSQRVGCNSHFRTLTALEGVSFSMLMCYNEHMMRHKVYWKLTFPPSWTQLVLSSLYHVLWSCRSFKGCALPPSLLFYSHLRDLTPIFLWEAKGWHSISCNCFKADQGCYCLSRSKLCGCLIQDHQKQAALCFMSVWGDIFAQHYPDMELYQVELDM